MDARQHPALQSVSLAAEASDATAHAKKADRFPSFAIGLDWIITGNAMMPRVPDRGKDAVATGASVRLPLWHRNYGDAISTDRAQARAQRAERQSLTDQPVAEFAGTMASVRDAVRRVGLYEITLPPQAEAAYASVLGAYTSGRSSVAQTLLAQRDLLELHIDLHRARRLRSCLGATRTCRWPRGPVGPRTIQQHSHQESTMSTPVLPSRQGSQSRGTTWLGRAACTAIGIVVGALWNQHGIIAPSSSSETQQSTDATQSEDQSGEQHETIWTCSTNPQIRRHEPGKFPICGMDFIPADEGNSAGCADAGLLRLSDRAKVLARLRTTEVRRPPDVQRVLQVVLGGMTLTRTVGGRERYPIRVQYMREQRDSVESIDRIFVPAPGANTSPWANRRRCPTYAVPR